MSTLKEILDARFGGVITHDLHQESDGKACALELLSVKKGIPFTDDPELVRCFDFRHINDMEVPDDLRTTYMLHMLEAYEDSLDWNEEKQKKVLERIVISTVNRLIADLPGLSETVVADCKAAKTLHEAETATLAAVGGFAGSDLLLNDAIRSVARAAGHIFNWRFENASQAVSAAVTLADAYATNAVWSCNASTSLFNNAIFIRACKIWLEAVKD